VYAIFGIFSLAEPEEFPCGYEGSAISCAPLSKLLFKLRQTRFNAEFHLIVKSSEELCDWYAEHDGVADRNPKRRHHMEAFVSGDSLFVAVSKSPSEFALAQSRVFAVDADIVGQPLIQFFVFHSAGSFCVRPFVSR